MSDYSIVGSPAKRGDGCAKAAGEAVFTGDIRLKNAWVCGVVRSGAASGVIQKIVMNKKFDWSKVVAITAKDLPGANYVAMTHSDYPILADKEIVFATQGVALVAAPDKRTLKEAMNAISVLIYEYHPVLTIEDSLACKRIIHGEDNILEEYNVSCGDADGEFEAADMVVEGTYRTGYQEHAYLEPQGVIAVPKENGRIIITGSLQCPYYVHAAVVQALGAHNNPESVVIRQAVTGGGFGGKEDYPSILAVWAALLARKAGKPVKFFYDREEDMLCTTKRHPSKIYHKTAVKKDGTITAMEIDIILDGGAATTMSSVVLSRSILHATGCYRVPNARIRARAVATNTPPNGAFRGFGVPQSLFALERHMDRIADALGMSPLDVRLKNVMRAGDKFPFGQTLESGVSAGRALMNVVERSDYVNKRAKYIKQNSGEEEPGRISRVRRGIGLSLALHGGGFTGAGEDKMGTRARVEIDVAKSVINVLASSAEMGQGAATILSMLAAETFGVPLSSVAYPLPDTSKVPNSGPTVASRTTMYVGSVVQAASKKLIEKLKAFLEKDDGSHYNYENGIFNNGSREIPIFEAADMYSKGNEKCPKISEEAGYEPDPGHAWDEEKYEGTAYKGYSWMAQVVEVLADMDTYEVTPERATIAVELGRVINPILATGQIEGGALQSYGWAGIENLGITEKGEYTSGHLSGYTIPTTLDAPSFDVALLEEPCEFGAEGAKGIGELPMDGGAPAFAAAVQNAMGVFAERTPITGEYLFSLESAKGGAK